MSRLSGAGVEALCVVCGTSGQGFKLSPAMGAEIVELVLTGRSELLAPFVIDRVYDVNRERSR
jgi:glycine/D-amino acid oxidase-like deaminating enzyme